MQVHESSKGALNFVDLRDQAKLLETLSGRRVTAIAGFGPYYEEFKADGRWIGWRGGRGVRMSFGSWKIDDGKVLVKLDDGPSDFRIVRRNSSGELQMRKPSFWSVGDEPVVYRSDPIVE